jgi:hypothetical protein
MNRPSSNRALETPPLEMNPEYSFWGIPLFFFTGKIGCLLAHIENGLPSSGQGMALYLESKRSREFQ